MPPFLLSDYQTSSQVAQDSQIIMISRAN